MFSNSSSSEILDKIAQLEATLKDLEYIGAESITLACHLDDLIELRKAYLFHCATDPLASKVEMYSHATFISQHTEEVINHLNKLLTSKQETFSFFMIDFNEKMVIKTMFREDMERWIVSMHFSYLGALRILISSDRSDRIPMHYQAICDYLKKNPLADLIANAYRQEDERAILLFGQLELLNNSINEFQTTLVVSKKRKSYAYLDNVDESDEESETDKEIKEASQKLVGFSQQYPRRIFTPHNDNSETLYNTQRTIVLS